MTRKADYDFVPLNAVEAHFSSLEERLGRVPRCEEFKKAYPKDYKTVEQGLHGPEDRGYNGLLEHMGREVNRYVSGYWSGHPERIREAYHESERKHGVGKVTSSLFKKDHHSGAYRAIVTGKYDPKIRKWKAFAKSMEGSSPKDRTREEKRRIKTALGLWNAESIESGYVILREDLRGIPSEPKIREHYGQDFITALENGAIPNVSDYTSLRDYMESKLKKNSLTVNSRA